MQPGEKLDDDNLWNDNVQFLGELANRFESPLPFKYEDSVAEDPDVADCVTALVTYCEAYGCHGSSVSCQRKICSVWKRV